MEGLLLMLIVFEKSEKKKVPPLPIDHEYTA